MLLSPDHPEQIIKHLARRSDHIGEAAQKAMLGFIQDKAAPAIRTSAMQKAPKLFRDLVNSARSYNVRDGANVVFGGLAAAYAARQHEDKHMSHKGVRRGRWVYRGSGVRTVLMKPGDWNEPKRLPGNAKKLAAYRARVTAWANAITRRRPFYGGAQGVQLIEWAGVRWRFKKASYASRHPAVNYPKVGQRHFLHGGPSSALEEKRSWMVRGMAKAGLQAANKAAKAA